MAGPLQPVTRGQLMPTYEELVYAIHIFLHEISQHTQESRMPTGGDIRIPGILIEFANPRKFTDEIHEHLMWARQENFHSDYGQDAYEAFMTMRELCARAMQYGGIQN